VVHEVIEEEERRIEEWNEEDKCGKWRMPQVNFLKLLGQQILRER